MAALSFFTLVGKSIGQGPRALLSGNCLEVSLALDLGRNPLSFCVKAGLPKPHTETLL